MIEYYAQATPHNVLAEGEPFFTMIDGHRVKLVLQYRYDRLPQETPAVVHYASGKILASVAMMHAKKLAYGAMRGRKAPSDRDRQSLQLEKECEPGGLHHAPARPQVVQRGYVPCDAQQDVLPASRR